MEIELTKEFREYLLCLVPKRKRFRVQKRELDPDVVQEVSNLERYINEELASNKDIRLLTRVMSGYAGDGQKGLVFYRNKEGTSKYMLEYDKGHKNLLIKKVLEISGQNKGIVIYLSAYQAAEEIIVDDKGTLEKVRRCVKSSIRGYVKQLGYEGKPLK